MNSLTATDIRIQIGRLVAERHDAVEAGLGNDASYMGDLEAELAGHRAAYVGAAVTEIATLRAQLSGPLQG
jgi:hypothetical protein